MPALDAVMKIRMDKQFVNLATVLASGFSRKDRPAKGVRAAVALTLDFWTWRRLASEGTSDNAAAALMVGAVRGAATDWRHSIVV